MVDENPGPYNPLPPYAENFPLASRKAPMDEFADKHEPFRVISDSGVEHVVIPYSHALVPSPDGSSEIYSITQYRLIDGQPIVRLADDTFRLETGERLRIKGIPR